jgi:hypothetical protein
MYIRDALEKEKRKYIGLKIGSIHRPTEDVGRFPEV